MRRFLPRSIARLRRRDRRNNALVADLRAQGVPLHGVGIQGHFIGEPHPDELRANLQALGALGVIVEFTEHVGGIERTYDRQGPHDLPDTMKADQEEK